MTSQLDLIGVLDAPVFLVNIAKRSTVVTAHYARAGNVVRKVRGWKCRNVRSLMSEFGAAFQFFDGFGENWYALEECMSYLDEWLDGEGYVVVVERAGDMLREAPDELRWFVAVMNDVARSWAQPIMDNDRFDRPARPFQVVLEFDGDVEVTRRFEEAGAILAQAEP